MRFQATVFPVSFGQHGPFDDGRKIDYVDVAPAAGVDGDVIRITLAQGITRDRVPLRRDVALDLELYQGSGKLKLRTYGVAEVAAAA